jgi:hypothetical protein
VPFLLILAAGVLLITYRPEMTLGVLRLLGRRESPVLLSP